MAFAILVSDMHTSLLYLPNSQLARTLYRHLQWRYHGVPWPSILLNPVDLTSHFVKRINEASVSNLVDKII